MEDEDFEHLSQQQLRKLVRKQRSQLQKEQARRKRAEHERDHDLLTGCLTRRGFDRRAQRRIRIERQRSRSSGIVFFDVDDFKLINDRLGHEAGDDFLTLLGRRLREDLQECELIGRKGGDEFWILLSTGDRSYADITVCRIDAVLEGIRREFVVLYGEKAMRGVRLTVSAGVCVSRKYSLSKMCALADKRMYENKYNKKREVERAS